jgi:hypothetical protein
MRILWGMILAASLGSVSWGQLRDGHDRWLMQNYKFVGPPAPGSIQPASPAVRDLREIQNRLMNIMWRASIYGDAEAALAAAAQAAANAQLLERMTGQARPVQPTGAVQPPRPTREFRVAAGKTQTTKNDGLRHSEVEFQR